MKIFTLLFIGFLFSFSAGAQSLSFVSPTPSPLYGTPASEMDATVGILNSGPNAISVKVMRYRNLAPGHKSYYCWYINCYSDTVNLSTDSSVIFPGSANTDWSFHGKLDPQGYYGVSDVRFKFFDMYNPSDSVSITFVYDFNTAIIDPGPNGRNPLSEAFPNPANNLTSINFNVADESDTRLVIYNLLGEVVKETKLKGRQGTLLIVTSDLGQGIYYCSLFSGGKVAATRKLVIAHK